MTSRNAIFVFRIKHACPVCNEEKLNIPLHLRVTHDWSHEGSSAVLHQFGLRKPYERKQKTKEKDNNEKDENKSNKKDHRYKKICPIENCFKVSKNLGEHLRSKIHNIKPSPYYYNLLKIAVRHDPSLIPSNIKSPRKSYMSQSKHILRNEISSLQQKEPINVTEGIPPPCEIESDEIAPTVDKVSGKYDGTYSR